MLLYVMSILNILPQFGIFYGDLIYFVVIWYILPWFGTIYQDKSGNPEGGALGITSVPVNIHLKNAVQLKIWAYFPHFVLLLDF
jgi:hypothetical protein